MELKELKKLSKFMKLSLRSTNVMLVAKYRR